MPLQSKEILPSENLQRNFRSARLHQHWNGRIVWGYGDTTYLKGTCRNPLMHYKACISHNGGGVIFTSDRAGSADIFRASSDGSGWQRFTVDRAFDDFGMLSPDGRWLAFVSTRAAQDVLYETGVSGAQIGRHADPKFESFISLGVDL